MACVAAIESKLLVFINDMTTDIEVAGWIVKFNLLKTFWNKNFLQLPDWVI